MLNSRIIFALGLILAVTILPATLSPVHAQEFGTMTIAIAGPGKVYWKGTYNGATYGSGWVNASESITLPEATMITFLQFPLTGHHFTNWIVNGFDQGSDSPFVLFMGQGAAGSVIGNFDGTLVKSVDGTYGNSTIASPVQTPGVLAPPPVQYATFQINVQGSGTVFWSSSYGSSTESGSTNSGYSILVPYGATVTFSATPTNGHAFSNWNVNSAYAGSTNPYVVTNINTLSPSTVTAVFA